MSQDIRSQIKPGQTVRIYQKIKEVDNKGKEKERLQVFEGVVLARKGRNTQSATILVHKQSFGVGVDKIFPLFSPVIAKIEILSQAKVRRAKLYFLRNYKKRLKEIKK